MSDKFPKLSLILTFSESTRWVIVCRDDAMLFCLSEIPCTSRCNAEHALWPFMASLISTVICLSSVATLFSSVCLCRISLASMLFKMVVLLEDEDDVFSELFPEPEHAVWKNPKISTRAVKYPWRIMTVRFSGQRVRERTWPWRPLMCGHGLCRWELILAR